MLANRAIDTNIENQISQGFDNLYKHPDYALSIFLNVQSTIQYVFHPLWHESLIGQARVYQIKGDYAQAISIYTYLIYAPMIICKTFVSMSRCYHEMENYGEAKRAIYRGLEFWTYENGNYNEVRLLKLSLASILSSEGGTEKR